MSDDPEPTAEETRPAAGRIRSPGPIALADAAEAARVAVESALERAEEASRRLEDLRERLTAARSQMEDDLERIEGASTRLREAATALEDGVSPEAERLGEALSSGREATSALAESLPAETERLRDELDVMADDAASWTPRWAAPSSVSRRRVRLWKAAPARSRGNSSRRARPRRRHWRASCEGRWKRLARPWTAGARRADAY